MSRKDVGMDYNNDLLFHKATRGGAKPASANAAKRIFFYLCACVVFCVFVCLYAYLCLSVSFIGFREKCSERISNLSACATFNCCTPGFSDKDDAFSRKLRKLRFNFNLNRNPPSPYGATSRSSPQLKRLYQITVHLNERIIVGEQECLLVAGLLERQLGAAQITGHGAARIRCTQQCGRTGRCRCGGRFAARRRITSGRLLVRWRDICEIQ